MSTSPSSTVGPAVSPSAGPVASTAASTAVSTAVFSPIPQARTTGVIGALPVAGTADGVREAVDVTASATEHMAGYAAGYAAGWARGSAAAAAAEQRALAEVAAVAEADRAGAAAALASALSGLEQAAAAMRARVVPAVDAVVDVLAAAAIDLAEAVVGHEVARDDQRGAHGLARALTAAPEHTEVTVRLHPADLAHLGDLTGTALAVADPTGRRVALVADPRLAPGDAVADFPGGQVDARVATALGRMRAATRSGGRVGEQDDATALGSAS